LIGKFNLGRHSPILEERLYICGTDVPATADPVLLEPVSL
jgi:hypothetical protein